MRGSVRFTGAKDLRGWREIFTRDVILRGKIPDRLELTVTVGHVLTALAARMRPQYLGPLAPQPQIRRPQ